MKNSIISFILSFLFFVSYSQSEPQFQLLKSGDTGIKFRNQLDENPRANVLTYEYFYNGGGVAIGDINNDGLDDIYFSANMKPNELYLNMGNMKFKNITTTAGVSCETGWKTGVNMIDINGDGLLDIYVCLSGKGDPEKRRNKLFINNGDLTFSEKSKESGLDDPGHSTQAAFLDYDRDGDLDMYLVNHNITVIREVEFEEAKKTRHPYAGDKLFRNDDGHFVDVSENAGIKGSPLGFGLGISVADVNKDGWPDIYVTNDYIETDYVYINNRDGTFTDRMTEYMQHISYFSMGVDVSDFNNDGWPDIFTLDMLPEDNKRQKLLYGPENYEHFALMVMNGFYFQNMRNMLHLNNGNGTYSEIGQYSGVSKTDWSWSPLFADFDNDGLKDLFITNGYYRDYTNRDFLKYKGDYYFEKARAKQKADTFQLVSTMTSTPLHNYMYKNNGDLTFSDQSKNWGFGDLNFSNGAAYADLDNDGDLELVVNNQNELASFYKNLTREKSPDQNYIQIKLVGRGKNTKGIGTKISIYTQGELQYFEQVLTRGFQSSVSDRIHFGLKNFPAIDSINIIWPDGKFQSLKNVKSNQLITITQEGNPVAETPQPESTLFSKVNPLINYTHTEAGFNDFKRQPLLMTMFTNCGPVIATADVNKDGLIDAFIGGTEDNPGKIFLQKSPGSFIESTSKLFEKKFTDADAYFFDADNDQDVDLYVVSGGYNEYTPKDKALQDRLYLNDGTGNFTKSSDQLPEMHTSKSCIAGSDFDHDGDIDLFVGGRVIPGQYPLTPESFLLKNNAGTFENIAGQKNLELAKAGMITDAKWTDLNNDGWEDLILIGEFMSVKIFLNDKGKELRESSKQFFDEPINGLWNKMVVQDFDKDGDQDMILGNFGLNSQLTASKEEPLSLVVKDFDKNGSVDPILCYFNQGKSYPFASRDELLDQMYSMRSRYTSYESYCNVQLKDIFSAADLKSATTLIATNLETVYLENTGTKFKVRHLPAQAQLAPVGAIATLDFNRDGNMDFILAGNQSSIRIRMGVIDANFGQLFQGDGKGNFVYVPQKKSGLKFTGDVKALQPITINRILFLLIGINNVGLDSYRLN